MPRMHTKFNFGPYRIFKISTQNLWNVFFFGGQVWLQQIEHFFSVPRILNGTHIGSALCRADFGGNIVHLQA